MRPTSDTEIYIHSFQIFIPISYFSSFRSVPQITNIRTGIGNLQNGTEPKFLLLFDKSLSV